MLKWKDNWSAIVEIFRGGGVYIEVRAVHGDIKNLEE